MAFPPRGNRMPRSLRPFAAYVLPTESTLSVYILPPIFIVAEVSCLRRSKGSPTDFTEFTELLAECILPQISQICTDGFAEYILPQISQNSQNFLLRIFSHRFHRSAQMVRVPSRGCTCLKCTNREEVHQPKISSICVDLCNLWYALCCCGGKDTSATIFRSLTICVDL